MKKLIVVGGGIFGTMHAYLALQRGFSVIHCEKDLVAQSASVRNFGLIWVSGRESGPELDLALRARELWGEVGTRVPSTGFRANGSLTIARNPQEWQVLQEAAAMEDAERRGFELLTRQQTVNLEPALRGDFLGALRCTLDAAAEPPLLLPELRKYLKENDNYQWLPNFEVTDFRETETGYHVVDVNGTELSGDLLVLCPGASHRGFLSTFLSDAPIRRVRLQMAAMDPLPTPIGHSIADGDSLRYYPAFKDLSLDLLPPQTGVALERRMQLLLVQRLDGSLTIGDTHEYDEPFAHELSEDPYDHLRLVIGAILGGEAPRIARRWDGIYSQSTSADLYLRKELSSGAVVVTGGGGRGNTLSPAIAEETFIKWHISN